MISRYREEPCPRCGATRSVLNGAYSRERRLRAGITLREMARRLGVCAAYVSDMELGKRTFLPRYAERYP